MLDASSSADMVYRPFLFEYGHAGQRWGFEIIAASREDAEARLKALSWAQYKGEVFAKVPVPGASIVRRIAALLGR